MATKVDKAFGKVFAEFQRNAGHTQEKLAFECVVHPTYISQIERVLKSPTVRKLVLFAKTAEVSPADRIAKLDACLQADKRQ